jgi:hypothetical protein
MTTNIPDISYLDVLPEENRIEALEWISQQPEAEVDDQVDRLSRWEIRISFCGFDNIYHIHDRATKQTKTLTPNTDNW